MTITIIYKNGTIKKYNSLNTIINYNLVSKIDCSNNNITSLPDNMNFPNLQNFDCSNNNITLLPENMNFPNLKKFICSNNKLISLPDNMNFPNLKCFYCCNNNITLLPDNMNFPNLQTLYCSRNILDSLPNNMNFPNLQKMYCSNNRLRFLPNNMNFPNLQEFYCSNNLLTSFPVYILNFRNLREFSYINNRIELSLQIERFINRINSFSKKELNVYTDTENVHNSNIQMSVRDSINNLTTRTDLKKYNIDQLNSLIIENKIITETSKSQLFEYINDMTVHSLLLLTFSEVLWFIIQTIITDFQIKEQEEIFKILNQEIIDSDCKCFTGRMNRVINCLNGFSPLVNINIKDGEQIGNIIILVKNKLELMGVYTVENHKIEVEKELLERNYAIETIKTWLEYID
jgi:Leucine-rich repeat (LRR) protein